MKWSVFILACLQLLVVQAQAGRGSYRSCGLNKICVPRHLCNKDNMEVNKHGRRLLDIRMNSTNVCEYLEKCCHIEDKMEKNPEGTVSFPTNNQNQKCGYSNEGGLIYENKNADHNEAPYAEFPWMVAILHKDAMNKLWYKCGGSLLTPLIVLTAAHCVYNIEANELTVRAGEWDMATKAEPLPYQQKTVSKRIIHESFDNESLIFDVALLTVEEPFIFEQHIQPICLPKRSYLDGSRCFVTGWGKKKFDKNERYQYLLKKISMPLVDREVCQNQLRTTRLSELFELHDSFICAGGELGHDACTGDGGSPLVCRIPGTIPRYFQAGIVSWGIGCGEQNIPGSYANLDFLQPWLIENLGKQNADFKYFTA